MDPIFNTADFNMILFKILLTVLIDFELFRENEYHIAISTKI